LDFVRFLGFRTSTDGSSLGGGSVGGGSSRITPDDDDEEDEEEEGDRGDAPRGDAFTVDGEPGGHEGRRAPVISFSGKRASSNTHKGGGGGSSGGSGGGGGSGVRRVSGSTADTTAVEAIARSAPVHRLGGAQLELADMVDGEWEEGQ
jgi:hypothetical protein